MQVKNASYFTACPFNLTNPSELDLKNARYLIVKSLRVLGGQVLAIMRQQHRLASSLATDPTAVHRPLD